MKIQFCLIKFAGIITIVTTTTTTTATIVIKLKVDLIEKTQSIAYIQNPCKI